MRSDMSIVVEVCTVVLGGAFLCVYPALAIWLLLWKEYRDER